MDSGIMINLNLRPSPLNADDAVIKETWAKQYPLKPFLEIFLLTLNHMTI